MSLQLHNQALPHVKGLRPPTGQRSWDSTWENRRDKVPKRDNVNYGPTTIGDHSEIRLVDTMIIRELMTRHLKGKHEMNSRIALCRDLRSYGLIYVGSY